MIYNITSSIDSTMYEQYENRNTGIDEVLQIDKIISESSTNNTFNSRILTKFDLGYISQSILDGHIKDTFRAKLELFSAEHKNLATILNIETFAVSQSWNEGSGRFTNIPLTSNGSSWTYRDNDISKTQWTTSSFATATTGSINASGIAVGGGEWYTGSLFQGSQQFLRGE